MVRHCPADGRPARTAASCTRPWHASTPPAGSPLAAWVPSHGEMGVAPSDAPTATGATDREEGGALGCARRRIPKQSLCMDHELLSAVSDKTAPGPASTRVSCSDPPATPFANAECKSARAAIPLGGVLLAFLPPSACPASPIPAPASSTAVGAKRQQHVPTENMSR